MNKTALLENLFSKQASGIFFNNNTAHIRNRHFLGSISNNALLALTSNAKLLSYPKQTVIVSANNEMDRFYIILSGRVRMFISDTTGKEVTLSFQEPGTHFGEVALLTSDLMSVSVLALQKTVCAVISKQDFFVWLLNYPEATFILLNVMSEKIKQLTNKVKEMSLLDTYGRLMAILEGMAVEEKGEKVIYNLPSQQTLASMAGVSRKTINKVIAELIQTGYLSMQHKNLHIKNTSFDIKHH